MARTQHRPVRSAEVRLRHRLILWQVLVGLCVAWTAFEVPMSWSLEVPVDSRQIVIDLLISLIMACDLLVFHRYKAHLLGAGAGRSAEGAWIAIGMLAMVPFDVISYVWQTAYMSDFQLLRLMAIFRVLKVINLHNRLLIPFTYSRMVGYFIVCFVAIHVIACVWVQVHHEVHDLDAYIESLYWVVTTITTVGYGDITPDTTFERVVTMLVMILGVVFFSAVLASVSKVMMMSDRHKEETRRRMHDLTLFMEHYQIPWPLQKEIFAFYDYRFSQRVSADDNEIIADLPESFREDIKTHMKVKLIRNLRLFKGLSMDCLTYVASHLKYNLVPPDTQVIRKGDPATEVFIVAHGMVRVVKEGVAVATLSGGQCLGEMSFISGSARTSDAFATTYAELYMIDKETLDRALKQFPRLQQRMQEIARERRRG